MRNFSIPWRAFTLFLLAIMISLNASALEKKYYYKTTVSATGGGKVYASPDRSTPSDGVYNTEDSIVNNDSVIYLFAKPDQGKAFEKWTYDGKSYTDNPQRIVYSEKIEKADDAINHVFIASFAPAAVSVVSENTALGSVSIDKANNAVNDVVTLTAKPYTNTFNGCALEGWYINGEAQPVSISNPYTFTITNDNQGEYTAKIPS